MQCIQFMAGEDLWITFASYNFATVLENIFHSFFFYSLSHFRSLSLFSTFTAMQLCHTFGKCLLLISFNLTLPLSTMTPHYIEYNQQSESVRHSKYPKVCPLVCGVRSGDAAEILLGPDVHWGRCATLCCLFCLTWSYWRWTELALIWPGLVWSKFWSWIQHHEGRN